MGDDVKKVFNTVVDVGTNIATGGLVGYDGDNGFGTGAVSSPVVDVLKDVTGATAAEEANKQAADRFRAEQTERERLRNEAKAKTAREQLTASRLAGVARGSFGSARDTGTQRGGVASGGSNNQSVLGDEADFLGL